MDVPKCERFGHVYGLDDACSHPVINCRATSYTEPAGFAPIAIGLALTLIHLVSIPVTNTSVNTARSTGVAVIQGGWAIRQLWLFWIAPIIGSVLAGILQRWLSYGEKTPVETKM